MDIAPDQINTFQIDGVDHLQNLLQEVALGRAEFQQIGETFVFNSAAQPEDAGIPLTGTATVRFNTSEPTTAAFEFDNVEELAGDGQARIAHALAVKSTSTRQCDPVVWTLPTQNPRNPGCEFGGSNCGAENRAHTGIDFSGAGAAVAIGAGTVVYAKRYSSSDAGMGSVVIVRHEYKCSGVKPYYSLYAHLDSIDPRVRVGTIVDAGFIIGQIGSSGFGERDYWRTHAPFNKQHHLHFELRWGATLGNPYGVGRKNSKCKNGVPENAAANSCFGYVSKSLGPEPYGYVNPRVVFDLIKQSVRPH